MDTVSNQFECAICLGAYTEPKFLSCYHTFCKPCLEDLVQNIQPLNCPMCRKFSDIPPGGVSGLQTNYYILESEELKNRRCKDGECKEKDMFCKNCQQYFCNSCVKIHKSFNACKNHLLIPTNGGQPISPEHVIPLCDQHPGQILDRYCFTCSNGICSKCDVTTLIHSSHQVVDLQCAEDQCNEELKMMKQKLDILSNYFSNNVVTGESFLNDRIELCSNTCDSIDRQANKQCEEVKAEIGKIARIIDDNQHQIEAQVKDRMQKLEDVGFTIQPGKAKPADAKVIQCSGESYHDGASTKQNISSDILTTEIELTTPDNQKLKAVIEKQIQYTQITLFVRKFNVSEFTLGKLNRSERLYVGRYSFTLTTKRWMDKHIKPMPMEMLEVMLERNDDMRRPLEVMIRISFKTISGVNAPLIALEKVCIFARKESKNGWSQFSSWGEIENGIKTTDQITFHSSIAIRI